MIVSLFWIGYVIASSTQFYLNAKEVTEQQILQRQQQMSFVQESFIPLVLTENFSLLKERLEKSRTLNLVDFYIVQRGDQVALWYNNFDNLTGINVNYQIFNRVVENEELAIRTVKLQDTKFTVGVLQNKNRAILKTAWMMKSFIIRDLVIVTAILSLIVYLLLKDIIDLSKVLSSRSRADISKIKTRSLEADTLLKASMGLEGERVRLEKLSEVYGETVGPAIKHELQSGRPAPYSFQATMCRVDLNGYTQLFLEKDDTYLIQILNKYFARARAVIERYDGLIYQFVGDEIVFQFKDEMSPELSTESLATACIRDLFHEASLIEAGLPKEANHYFKLKGSFAKGMMRFTQLDEGHALSGLPLIESVRLLSLVDDKSHQVLTFFKEASPFTEGLAFIFDRKVNQLKGFKEESLLCRARDFNSIDWVFNSARWEQLAYFRSDTHLLHILRKVRLMALTKREGDLISILSALKHHRFAETTGEVIEESDLVLSNFVHSESEGLLSTKALSAMVSLVGRVIPAQAATPRIIESLTRLLDHNDPRVQANAILVLGHFNYPARKIWEKMYSENNRVAADTIVEVAKQQLNEDLLAALERLLSSPHPNHRKSGAYARDCILRYYAEVDPVFFEASPHLARIRAKASA